MKLVFRAVSQELLQLGFSGDLQGVRLHFGTVEVTMGPAVTCSYRVGVTINDDAHLFYIPGSFTTVTVEGTGGEEGAMTAVVFIDAASIAQQVTELVILDYEESNAL